MIISPVIVTSKAHETEFPAASEYVMSTEVIPIAKKSPELNWLATLGVCPESSVTIMGPQVANPPARLGSAVADTPPVGQF